MKTIAEKYTKYKSKISEYYSKIEILQSECTHPNHTKEYKGSGGNYDPSSDAYWIEFRCPDCGKFWVEDQ